MAEIEKRLYGTGGLSKLGSRIAEAWDRWQALAAAAPTNTPGTQQISKNDWEQRGEVYTAALFHPNRESAAHCLLRGRYWRSHRFGNLYWERKTIMVFDCNFLCYTCKEYVEDLAKIPSSALEDANVSLIAIGQSSYIHIESNIFSGSIWRAITSTIFYFQGDPAQQGGSLIVGPGNRVRFLQRDMNRLKRDSHIYEVQITIIQAFFPY
ncbi:hypothetical protein XELAEV_18006970mg [Xenopus laevis]|uniref:Uncharacterized protein n=1 Tax=Xenopus laevis TaxID=8355 RepID=A0A974E073_XENLA|nr:hypothetical protein XELAEV_18006970mg [Xenopus laevis]